MGLSLAAAGQSAQVDGLVRVTASQLISAYLLGPVVERLRREHPGIILDLVATNDVRDLRRREADIAVRNGAPAHADLIGKRLPDSVARPYATPAYLASLGEPLTAELLAARGAFFGFDDVDRMVQGLRAIGLPVTEERFVVITGDHLVQWTLARRGLGVCFAMTEVGDADPDMVPALPDLPGLPIPMWVVAHREVRTSRRIRIVFDAIVQALGGSRGAAPADAAG